MSARDKLQKAKAVDRAILVNQRLLLEIEEMRKLAEAAGAGSETIQSLEEQKTAITESIIRDQATKTEAIRIINTLEKPLHRAILTAYYISGMQWDKIADDFGYSVSHTQKMHGWALNELDGKEAK